MLASPALAQTYHDTSGAAVPGVVVVDPTDNAGPLFTSTNPDKVSGTFSATLSAFFADAGVFAVERGGELGTGGTAERDDRRRL
jgi:hypothetical protein